MFAVIALVLGLVSFQLVIDHHVPAELAIRTSFAAAWANPGIVAVWGLTVAAILIAGSIPVLLGLAVALPVLSHASWHLYRRLVTAG